MNKLDKVVYTGIATATGGREGKAHSSDNSFEVTLSTPKEMGGTGAAGTNPEQLFAAGYSACFLGAMKFVATNERIKIPNDASITGKVGIGPIPQGFGIQAELNITLSGMDRALAEDLIQKAHKVCPYSNATRGNIEFKLNLV